MLRIDLLPDYGGPVCLDIRLIDFDQMLCWSRKVSYCATADDGSSLNETEIFMDVAQRCARSVQELIRDTEPLGPRNIRLPSAQQFRDVVFGCARRLKVKV